jgi:hypothetical protein
LAENFDAIGVTPDRNIPMGEELVCRYVIDKTGAARGTRTPDPIITNDVLYQLSYCGSRQAADYQSHLGQQYETSATQAAP